MKQRLVSYFPFYMYGMFSILLALGYEHNDVPASFTYIVKTFEISGIVIILVFTVCAVVTGLVWIDYRIRAAALIPLIAYGIATPFAFQAQTGSNQFYTSLIAGHFWSCFAIALMVQIVVLHDNHRIRIERFELWKDIGREKRNVELERKKGEAMLSAISEVQSGTK